MGEDHDEHSNAAQPVEIAAATGGARHGVTSKDVTRSMSFRNEFQTEQNLGIYGKARLLRAVQDELRRLQYSEMFVEAITDLLVPATAARLR